MNGKAHFMMGGIFGAGASLIWQHTWDLELIGMAVLASALPDFDTGSMARNKLSGNARKTKRNIMIAGAIGALYTYLHSRQWMSLAMLASVVIFFIGMLMSQTVAKKAILSVVAGVIAFSGIYYHMQWLIGLGLYIGLAPFTGHRTWTHSIWSAIYMYFLFHGAEDDGVHGALVGGMAGFVSHLLADAVTVEGVAFFYPILPFRFGCKLMRSEQTFRQYAIVAMTALIMGIFVLASGGMNPMLSVKI